MVRPSHAHSVDFLVYKPTGGGSSAAPSTYLGQRGRQAAWPPAAQHAPCVHQGAAVCQQGAHVLGRQLRLDAACQQGRAAGEGSMLTHPPAGPLLVVGRGAQRPCGNCGMHCRAGPCCTQRQHQPPLPCAPVRSRSCVGFSSGTARWPRVTAAATQIQLALQLNMCLGAEWAGLPRPRMQLAPASSLLPPVEVRRRLGLRCPWGEARGPAGEGAPGASASPGRRAAAGGGVRGSGRRRGWISPVSGRNGGGSVGPGRASSSPQGYSCSASSWSATGSMARPRRW
jgi:hypothetical protein